MRHSIKDSIVTLILDRPKVNALDDGLIKELYGWFEELRFDPGVRAVVLTGEGSFFSFGLDVPAYMSYPKDAFRESFSMFCDIYATIFEFPKPTVCAINGHAVAGGCILALACDYRIMASGKPKIGLNEITFGSTIPAGAIEMLKFAVGNRRASIIAYMGELLPAEKAHSVELVDKVVAPQELRETACEAARNLSSMDAAAFGSIKMALRRDAIENIRKRDEESIAQFVDLWYSEPVREQLAKIQIR